MNSALPKGAELLIDDLRIGYRSGTQVRMALDGVSLRVAPGEVLGLVGESGSGKSTLAYSVLRYLGRRARIESGTIRIDGMDVQGASPEQLRTIRRSVVSMVYQDPAASLNPTMSLGRQLLESIRLRSQASDEENIRTAHELLTRVNLADPPAMMKRFPHQVSGGQKQRILIAMAFATRPRLMICDEPTTALDVTTAAQVLDLLRELMVETGVSVLYISHDLTTIARIADRVAVLDHGKIVETGGTATLLKAPAHPYTRKLLSSVVNSPRQTVRRRVLFDDDAVVEGVASTASDRPRPVLPADGPALLEVRQLGVTYGRERVLDRLRGKPPVLLKAVDDVSLSIRPGETLGLVGESGCGKSTLSRALAGLVSFNGEIALEGRAYGSVQALDQHYRDAIQIVFQHPDAALNPKHSIGQILARPAARRDGLAAKALRVRVHELLDMVRLPYHYAQRLPHELSGGEKQRVCIARAFAARPSLVICDEITSALDVTIQGAILNLLADLQDESGMSYLFISHDLHVVRHVADRIAVMYLGQFVETWETLGNRAPTHPYTTALFRAMPMLEQANSN
ncbi:ABC transporter ATP-binding protein [Bordetella sp. BOR01]|uniref:dipeptide ABC transporter ATP-binding protein n=1 Tax=Bordetella sp. BOR01 TaxID=2854779 RepID=UPI001C470239|nr:ABC transporter ATP-binding protein [Bordetella sp. BOR01]MBV7483158.1 ABC transporter ATP-binding protein [Bordetella sp. BOR01]